ncbi:MAG: DUF1573 domain-containing protein [Gemmataceae bacterium]
MAQSAKMKKKKIDGICDRCCNHLQPDKEYGGAAASQISTEDRDHVRRFSKRKSEHFCVMRRASCVMRHALIFRSIPHGKRQIPFLTFVLLWGGLLLAAGCDRQGVARPIAPKSDIAGQPSLPLVPTESPLNLGEVPAGGRKKCDFWLTNQTDSPVEVAEIETSCDCLTIDMPNRTFMPAKKVEGHALLDLRKEPQFAGKLAIEAAIPAAAKSA